MAYAQVQKHPRYRADVPVQLLTTDGAVHDGATSNISMGGLFVRTQARMTPGTRVRVAFGSPAPEMRAYARVVHVMDPYKALGKHHPAGVGLMFESLTGQAQSVLRNFLFLLFRQGQRIPVSLQAQPAAPGVPTSGQPQLKVGDELGRYVVLERLGEGGMAEVWLARQHGPAGFNKTVVLKSMAPHLARTPQAVELFLDEARLASQLNHPNVVQVFALDEAGGVPFLVMEHLEGRNLAEVHKALKARGTWLSAPIAARITAECCAALEYAHNLHSPSGRPLGIVHRDVTPENILVTYRGQVKLLDFGIARAAENIHHTQPGLVRGKVPFLAPEQIRGEAVDHRVDVWGMGISLYVMLSGVLPFSGRTDLEILMAIAKQDFEPLSKRVPGIPRALEEIVDRALCKEPQLRFADIAQMRAALEAFLNGAPASSFHIGALMESIFPSAADPMRRRLAELTSTSLATPPPLQVPAPLPRPPRRTILGVAMGVGALLAGAGLWMPALPNVELPAFSAPATGTLTLITDVNAEVTIDGRPLGLTPLANLPLTEGTHAIELVNRELGVQRTVEVNIRAGTVRHVQLRLVGKK